MANKIVLHSLITIDQVADNIIEVMRSPECDNQDIKDAIIALAEIVKANARSKTFNSYF